MYSVCSDKIVNNFLQKTVALLLVVMVMVQPLVLGVSLVQAEEGPSAEAEVVITPDAEDEAPETLSPDETGEDTASSEINIETGDAVAGAEVENIVNTNVYEEVEPSDDTGSTGADFSDGGEDTENIVLQEGVSAEEGDLIRGETLTTSTEEPETGGEDLTTGSGEGETMPDSVTDSGDPGEAEDMSTLEEVAIASELPHENGSSQAETSVIQENDAVATNSLEVTAMTGDNQAGVGQNVVVTTGDALAYANVINVVNTNVLNSKGFITFFNQLFGQESLDLRDLFVNFDTDTSEQAIGCSLSTCEGATHMSVQNTNEGIIRNDVIVRSVTGGNEAEGAGTAAVATGDAHAVANVFNVLNTNIVDSNYLLVSFNNIGDLEGDIVIPGAEFFTNLFKQGGTYTPAPLVMQQANSAEVHTTVTATAETGGNHAQSDEGLSQIVTGDAATSVQVANQVNTNLFGGTSLMVLFRVQGDWLGDAIGVPEGVVWEEGPGGITLYNAPGETIVPSRVLEVDEITTDNEAAVENTIEVFALTGDNKAIGDQGAVVTSGNAVATANILNVVNTNVVGQNWILLMFNIFGDWKGNLAFGRPDLWLGGVASSVESVVREGSRLTYTLTVANHGDTRATDVELTSLFDNRLIAFSGYDDLGPGGDEQPEYMQRGSWDVGTLAAGASQEITIEAEVTQDLPPGDIPLEALFTIVARETDENIDDNTETLVLVARSSTSRSVGSLEDRPYQHYTEPADVLIEKRITTDTVMAGDQVGYTIHIKNNGGPVYYATLFDELYDEEGKLVNEQSWELGQVFAGEEIEVSYELEFSGLPAGAYTNEAQILGVDRRKSLRMGREYASPIARATVTFDSEADIPEESQACVAYIDTFMRKGADNAPDQVRRLQEFLQGQGAQGVVVSGIFDEVTDRAVKDFQAQHADEILSPWGDVSPSGYVYLTTRKKINEIACNNEVEFSLSQSQLREIERYRRSQESPSASAEPDQVGITQEPVIVGQRERDSIAPRATASVLHAFASIADADDGVSGVSAEQKTPRRNLFQSLRGLWYDTLSWLR